MKYLSILLFLSINAMCGILGPLENIIPNEKYSEKNQQNYHYTYDSSKARYRAIEDCEYYRKGSNKDDFCENVVRSRVYPVQTYETNPRNNNSFNDRRQYNNQRDIDYSDRKQYNQYNNR